MGKLYNNIDVICKQNGISVNEMCKKMGQSSSFIYELKSGRTQDLSSKIKSKIAKFFNISVDFLDNIDFKDSTPCPLCGGTYLSDDPKSIKEHEVYHQRWMEAVKKFGFCWSNVNYRNEVRWYVGSEIEDIDKEESVERLVKLYEARFKAYFSRAVMATDIPLNTITFEDYIAGLLSNKNYNIVPTENSEVYKYLVSKYGTKEGYIEGTYFKYNKNNRATTSNNSKTNKVLEKTLDCSANQKELITIYDNLNSDGQSQLMQQARNLSKIDEYKKCSNSEQVG